MPYKKYILENSKATEYIGLDIDGSIYDEFHLFKKVGRQQTEAGS